jgi:V8-like Glu-specific endopeptidase
MRLRATASGLALAAGLALTLTSAGLASAAVKDSATSSVARHAAATTKSEQQRIVDYWTPERMKSAIPVGSKREAKGKPGGGSSGGTAVLETPQPRFGKVFFTQGSANYVCSGTATTSSNGDVVTTAGHCVNEGPGAFVTNFAFVPAYDNGAAPYGTWTAQTLLTTTQWRTSGDFDYDVGFAVMNENSSNQSLTEVVGGYGIAFGQPRGQSMKAYGYPAAKPFNGQKLYSCTGVVVQDTYGGSQDQGLACNMTGGSSGGGWIQNGSVSSVTSFGYTGVKNVLWGPYFGSVVQAVYQSAAATS